MLAYIDYPGSREIVTNPLELINRYRSFPGALVSTIVMIGGVDVNEDYFKVWASLTGNRQLIEDTYSEIWSYIKGVANDKDLISLVMRIYEKSGELIDLVALSNALKLFLGLNIYDLGLAVIYENPLMVLNGVRMELRTGRALLTRRHRVEDIELSTVLVLQPETNRQVVDWGNPGVLPASGTIGDETVSDPAFTILTSGIKLISKPTSTKLTLLTQSAQTGGCDGQPVVLPLTLTGGLMSKLQGELMNHGLTVTMQVNLTGALECLTNPP
jgi:hypothetical protein